MKTVIYFQVCGVHSCRVVRFLSSRQAQEYRQSKMVFSMKWKAEHSTFEEWCGLYSWLTQQGAGKSETNLVFFVNQDSGRLRSSMTMTQILLSHDETKFLLWLRSQVHVIGIEVKTPGIDCAHPRNLNSRLGSSHLLHKWPCTTDLDLQRNMDPMCVIQTEIRIPTKRVSSAAQSFAVSEKYEEMSS